MPTHYSLVLASTLCAGGALAVPSAFHAELDARDRGEARRLAAFGAGVEVDHDRLRRELAATDAVVAELEAGRITLAAAVDEWEAITNNRPGFELGLELARPHARSHRERLALYGIAKVQQRSAADPSRLAAVMPRLSADFAALFPAARPLPPQP